MFKTPSMKPFITILLTATIIITLFSCKKSNTNSLQSNSNCYYVLDCAHNIVNSICGLNHTDAQDSMLREAGGNNPACRDTLVSTNNY